MFIASPAHLDMWFFAGCVVVDELIYFNLSAGEWVLLTRHYYIPQYILLLHWDIDVMLAYMATADHGNGELSIAIF